MRLNLGLYSLWVVVAGPCARLCMGLMCAALVLRGQGLITTVAGTEYLPIHTGLKAVDTPISSGPGLTFDPQGRAVVSDASLHVVYRIERDGTITVLAGNGLRGSSGDDEPAVNAALNTPTAVAYDPAGTLYIVDAGNNRVRAVSPAGVITSVLINVGFTRSLCIDSSGAIYLTSGPTVFKWVPGTGSVPRIAGGTYGFGGDGGPAVSASLNPIRGLAVDAAGNLYIADGLNHRIRRVSPDGIITTVAGTGQAGYSADGVLATAAALNAPVGIAVDRSGTVYFGEFGNFVIRRIDSNGAIRTVAGNHNTFVSKKADGSYKVPLRKV